MERSFYEPEERCQYYVSSEIKKLWKAEIDCFLELQRICEKHGIKYYACGGTLLGAIRHQGFIPWDDDMDVFMLEEDYYKLLSVAPKEIKAPYFFQSFETQPGFGPSMSRIRNSDTTACTQFEYDLADKDYNCGIFIDIFPLTSVSSSPFARKVRQFKITMYRAAIAGYEKLHKRQLNDKHGGLNPLILYWKIWSLFSTHTKISQKYLRACSNGDNNSEYVGLVPFFGFQEKFIFRRSWFEETIDFPFEYVRITCPAGYDEILKHWYGDYMVFKKGTAIHSMTLFDADVPYKEKLKDRYN